jgi:xanthine dehydrogenase YagT iron-sulfur-binding subunit
MKKHHNETEDDSVEREISRRTFLGSMSAAVAGAAMTAKISATEKPTPNVELSGMVRLVINGRRHEVSVEPRNTLLHVLRDKLGMTGTKVGCERGECGACTVLIDGIARYSCLTLALEVDGKEVTTIEGLLRGDSVGPVQQAFIECDAFQCGYCTPGQIMAAEALLRKTPNPSIEEIREEMSGNLCRCGAYQHIFRAVHRAAELRKA